MAGNIQLRMTVWKILQLTGKLEVVQRRESKGKQSERSSGSRSSSSSEKAAAAHRGDRELVLRGTAGSLYATSSSPASEHSHHHMWFQQLYVHYLT